MIRRSLPRCPGLGLLTLALPVAAFVLFVASPWLWLEPSPPPPRPEASGRPPDEGAQVQRALVEARDNCLVAALLAEGLRVAPPRFQTVELRRALETDLVLAQAHGELPALREEARRLERLGVARSPSPRSWQDVQLVTAAIHRYLLAVRSPAAEAARHIPQTIDRSRLRAYVGLDVDDLLDTWD